MLALIAFTPITFNFYNVFSIGVYNIEDDYFNSYSDGSAGSNLHLRINREYDNRYAVNTFIESISTGDVVNYGISSINILYFNDTKFVYETSVQFGTPRSDYSVNRFSLNLFKKSNFTCYGTMEVSLEAGGIPINDIINFQLTFILPLSNKDHINIDLAIYSLFLFHLFLYIIIPVTLFWIFKPAFRLTLTEEDIVKDEKYLNYLQTQAKEKE